MNNTETEEMYLVTIYRLKKRQNTVRSIDVANERNFSKSTVHDGLKNLMGKGLVILKAGAVTLTKEGNKYAENIQRKHELIVKALMMLGIDEDIAETNACGMEHVMTDDVYEALAKHVSSAMERKIN